MAMRAHLRTDPTPRLTASPFARVCTGSYGGLLAVNHIWKYSCTVTTRTVIQENLDASHKQVVYNIEPRDRRNNVVAPPRQLRIASAFEVAPALQANVLRAAQRTTSLPSSFRTMELAGVVVRLASSIAFYSNKGWLTSNVIRGGANIQVRSVAATNSPIAAESSGVFVSSLVDDHDRPNIMAALIPAINGENACVFTDVLAVEHDGAALVPSARDLALARGCWDALTMLQAQFGVCGVGALFGLCVTMGFNKEITLYGHTDEGSFFRDVLRSFDFAPPFGCILTDVGHVAGMIDPGASLSSFRCAVHSMLIAAAGAVALSDPMMEVNGQLYPTVYVSTRLANTVAGVRVVAGAEDADNITAQWASGCSAFGMNYGRALGELFGTPGGNNIVAGLIGVGASELEGTNNAHMRHPCIIAYNWVEPTGACPIGDDSYVAFTNSHGPLATVETPRSMPGFDGILYHPEASDNMVTTADVRLGYARRHGYLLHHTHHKRNGLVHMTLIQAASESFLLAGGRTSIFGRLEQRAPMHDYMWGRGHSQLIGGGELMYCGKGVRVEFAHIYDSMDGYLDSTNLANREELLTGNVIVSVTKLFPMTPAPLVPIDDNRASRQRTAASDAVRAAQLVRQQGRVIRRPRHATINADVAFGTALAPRPALLGRDMVLPPEALAQVAAVPDVMAAGGGGDAVVMNHPQRGANVRGTLLGVIRHHGSNLAPRAREPGREGQGNQPPQAGRVMREDFRPAGAGGVPDNVGGPIDEPGLEMPFPAPLVMPDNVQFVEVINGPNDDVQLAPQPDDNVAGGE